jgi:hypothetical protein
MGQYFNENRLESVLVPKVMEVRVIYSDLVKCLVFIYNSLDVGSISH